MLAAEGQGEPKLSFSGVGVQIKKAQLMLVFIHLSRILPFSSRNTNLEANSSLYMMRVREFGHSEHEPMNAGEFV